MSVKPPYKVISIKARALAAVLTAAALAGLAVAGFLIKDKRNDNLLLVKPLSRKAGWIRELLRKSWKVGFRLHSNASKAALQALLIRPKRLI